MEKVENDSVIGSLYSLRAGLSLVAYEKEAFESEVNDAKNRKKSMEREIDERISDCEHNLVEAEADLTHLKDEREDTAKRARRGALKKRNLYLSGISILSLVWLVFALFCVICIVVLCVGTPISTNSSVGKALIILGPISGVIVWFGGLAIFLKFIPNLNKGLKKCLSKEEHEEAIKKLPVIDRQIESLENALNSKRNDLSKLNSEAYGLKRKIDEEYSKECEKSKRHVIAAGEIIQALRDSYSYLIDMRDWENIDLIIYSLETRRADNMKEALQVVDGERRTNRITTAITRANMEIRNSIKDGLSNLRSEINANFCTLSQQITLHTTLLSSQLSEIANQTSMNRALIEKANTSSEKLADYAMQIKDSTKYIANHI